MDNLFPAGMFGIPLTNYGTSALHAYANSAMGPAPSNGSLPELAQQPMGQTEDYSNQVPKISADISSMINPQLPQIPQVQLPTPSISAPAGPQSVPTINPIQTPVTNPYSPPTGSLAPPASPGGTSGAPPTVTPGGGGGWQNPFTNNNSSNTTGLNNFGSVPNINLNNYNNPDYLKSIGAR